MGKEKKEKDKKQLPEHLQIRKDFVTCGPQMNYNVSELKIRLLKPSGSPVLRVGVG